MVAVVRWTGGRGGVPQDVERLFGGGMPAPAAEDGARRHVKAATATRGTSALQGPRMQYPLPRMQCPLLLLLTWEMGLSV